MTTNLILHRGSQQIGYDELGTINAPEPTSTWYPLPHRSVLDETVVTLRAAGFQPARVQLAVSQDRLRFFGVVDLRSPLADGVSLSVGIRNSNDKSLPIGFCAGNRTFVCDNLAFSSEVVVSRKHTRFGQERFSEALARAVAGLTQFKAVESQRIERFQKTDISETVAESLILRSFDRGIISAPQLPTVISEWRKPPYAEFEPRNLWTLENAYTGALTPLSVRSPQRYCAMTIALQALLAEAATPQMTVAA